MHSVAGFHQKSVVVEAEACLTPQTPAAGGPSEATSMTQLGDCAAGASSSNSLLLHRFLQQLLLLSASQLLHQLWQGGAPGGIR